MGNDLIGFENRFEEKGQYMKNLANPGDVRTYPDGRVDAVNAARFLGCSVKTLAHLRCSGRGPAFIKKTRIWYYVSDLEAWLNQSGKHRSTAQARVAAATDQGVGRARATP